MTSSGRSSFRCTQRVDQKDSEDVYVENLEERRQYSANICGNSQGVVTVESACTHAKNWTSPLPHPPTHPPPTSTLEGDPWEGHRPRICALYCQPGWRVAAREPWTACQRFHGGASEQGSKPVNQKTKNTALPSGWRTARLRRAHIFILPYENPKACGSSSIDI